MRRVRLTLQGEVQGVNLRNETAAYARAHGLGGWIRNDARGTVSLEAEAEPAVIDELLAWLRQGPRYARVSVVGLEELTPQGERTFQVVRWWHNVA